MTCYTIDAIKSGINDYFTYCEFNNYQPSFTKSEAFDEVIHNHSLQEIREYYNYMNNKQPTYSDISAYIFDVLYHF